MNLEQIWTRVSDDLHREFGRDTYYGFLANLVLKNIHDGKAILCVSTPHLKKQIEAHYSERILQLLGRHVENLDQLLIEVGEGNLTKDKDHKHSATINSSSDGKRHGKRDGNRGYNLMPNMVFDKFVMGKTNEVAYKAALKVANSSEIICNPLYIYGNVGEGKTHLLNSIGWHLTEKKKGNGDFIFACLTGENFLSNFVSAVRGRDKMIAFKDHFRSLDALLIDDIQHIITGEKTMQEFFHTFNDLMRAGKQIIVTANEPPENLEGWPENIRSRLAGGLSVHVKPSDYNLRLAVLKDKLKDKDDLIPLDVLELIARSVKSSIRELESSLMRVMAHSEFAEEKVTMTMALEILSGVLRNEAREVKIDEIFKVVAHYHSISVEDMSAKTRIISIAFPRQVAMFLAKDMTTLSLPAIARKFNKKNHTTVMHGIRKIEKMCKEDKEFNQFINEMRSILRNK